MEIENLLEMARLASSEASKAILTIYNSDNFEISLKSDHSPLTLADQTSHEIIVSYLEKTRIPILSEEGKDISTKERLAWDLLWIVDPLDGTKEFIKRNGEFTVNIALVKQGKPLLGVVEAPVLGQQFYGAVGLGAFLYEEEQTTSLSEIKELDETIEGIKVVASRSHLSVETEQFLDKLNSPEIVSMGSSLKFMMIAQGKADIYPRFAPTMEWDTAAAHAIIKALGGHVRTIDGQELNYNKSNLLNPFFKVY